MEDELLEENPAGTPSSRQRSRPTPAERRPGRTRQTSWLGIRLPSWADSGEELPESEALIDELQRQIRAANVTIQELQNQVHGEHNRAKEARSHFRTEQDTNRRLRQEIRSITAERESMSLSIQTQEAQIRQVQTLAFEGIGGNSWASGDDSTIRADLENLHKRLKAWAKKHAVEDMCELKELAAEERDSLITLLARVVRPHSGAQNVIEALESAPLNKKPLAMCLQGLLSRHAYTNIINRPFFVLEDAGETLHSVYHQIHQVNGNESHIWRSKTLRLLAASPPNAQLEGGLSNYSATQKDVCSTFANDFYNGPAQYLIKPSSRKGGDVGSQCFNELEAIVQYAGELSYRLWSRRTTLRVLSLPDLKDQPFTARSEYLKAHPLHRLYEDDDRCDGWFVSVVAHPAVLGFGSTDGKDYSTPRVWMKAEVWLTEDI